MLMNSKTEMMKNDTPKKNGTHGCDSSDCCIKIILYLDIYIFVLYICFVLLINTAC